MPMPRILILESYGPTRQALAVILERAGWEVTLSQTEHETFKALVNSHYDVLLVDLEMSTGDGWRVLQHIMPDGSTPVIAILNQGSPHSQKAQEFGVRTILYKPLRRKRLLDSTTAALNCC